MRYIRVFAILCVFLGGAAVGAKGAPTEGVTLETLERIGQRFAFFQVLPPEGEEPLRYIYADSRQHVHLYSVEKGRANLVWETVSLGARASALLVRDLDGDGRKEIVIGTTDGRILIYDSSSFDLLWENLQDRFESIECMTAENIDGDPQDELIFVANTFLYVYDSVTKTIEWQSQRNFSGKEIVLANVDADEQPEIILNTGVVIDSRFYNLEFESETRFGDRIRLLDTNGDNIPEIIGETTDFTIRIYDIYAERELW